VNLILRRPIWDGRDRTWWQIQIARVLRSNGIDVSLPLSDDDSVDWDGLDAFFRQNIGTLNMAE